MKRSEFKKILKECLLEILTEEPIIRNKLQEVAAPLQKKSNNANAKQIARAVTGADEFEAQNEDMLLEQINLIANVASGGNRKQAELMKAIFADTALNTLPKQEELAPGITKPDLDKPGVDLKELVFDGDLSRWAQVAFRGKK